MRVRVDQVIARNPQVSRREVGVPNVRPEGGVSESNIDIHTLVVSSEQESLSASDGALVVRGGAGIMGDLNVADELGVGTDLTVSGFTEVQGGFQSTQQADFWGVVNVNGVLSALSGATSLDTTTGSLVVDGGVGISGDLNVGSTANIAGVTSITNATASSSTSTGALVVTGGVGIGDELHVAGDTNVVDITVSGNLEHTGNKIGFFGSSSTQPSPIADATGAGDVVAQLNALLAALRTLGIIDT